MIQKVHNNEGVPLNDIENNSIQPKIAKQLPDGETPAYSEAAQQYQMDLEKSIYSNSVRLDFVDVTVEVPIKGGTKRILNKVSGYVKPGEILYIMGPSGGGKTTLLDFLCNRTKQTPENNVFLNKRKWTEKEFKKIARYCQQHPLLYEVLTVKETLDFAAGFFTKSAKLRNQRVERVIELLGLVQQANTKIGGMFYRGISGGQKQRVSVVNYNFIC
ncbi:P-loop containing nucleoside triphosphate hydrolase [Pseudocohnilembus persalinus]|uniref:p-loop containing nucleoside triphosphate hydrolase n=1 Tax=Pseudocohnilembus persalinus TaxID=266149 RepID=A0A0V0R4B4_PSEPJ|nr:P-loop containing nucleoside triphosphate hydrolase [Pseudocohnilembus persalinus]|eukprot:KRX09321.1 P-loop containing nucleoside triphosphate hydrolase [Pseudocohnilembus persalinus]